MNEHERGAEGMAEIAVQFPGFTLYKAYVEQAGKRALIHEYENSKHFLAWWARPDHSRMQRYGRDHFLRGVHTLCVRRSEGIEGCNRRILS